MLKVSAYYLLLSRKNRGLTLSFLLFFFLFIFSREGDFFFQLVMSLLVSITFFLAAFPIYRLKHEELQRVLVRPIGVWSITVLLYWVWGSSLTLFTHKVLFFTRDHYSLLIAQIIYIFGGSALIAGYFYRKIYSQSVTGTTQYISRWTTLQVAVIFIVLRLALSYFKQPTGIVDPDRVDQQVYIFLSMILGPLALVIFFDKFYPSWLRLLVSLSIVENAINALFSGSRFAVIGFFLSFIVAATIVGKYYFKPKHLFSIGLVILIGIIVSQMSRDLYGYSHARTEPIGLSSMINGIIDGLLNPAQRESSTNFLSHSATSERLGPVDTLALATEVVDVSSGNYMLGQSIYTGLTRVFLPYFLFPSKPAYHSAESWLSNLIGYTGDTHSNATTELYINFGVLGVILGMFVLGNIWRWTESFLLSENNLSTHKYIAYLIFVSSIFTAEREMADYLFVTLRTIGFVFFVGWFIAVLQRTKGTRSRFHVT